MDHGDPHGMAMFLLKKHGMAGDEPEAEQVNPDLEDAASDILSALDKRDAHHLAASLEDFIQLCGKDSGGHSEPDGDEGTSEAPEEEEG